MDRHKSFWTQANPISRPYLDEAISLIDAAEERIVLSSQYFPGGVTGDHLVRAYKKGVDVQIMYNDPSCNKLFKLGHKAALVKEKLMRPSKFFEGQLPLGVYLHTKGLASEKAAMIGSHNYLEIGVRLGTAEMTLLRRDTVFARFVQKVLQEQVNTEISVA